MGLVKVICVTEPDISYTRNKKLNVGEQYWGEYQESNLGSYGISRIYDIYNQDKIKQGHFFLKYFLLFVSFHLMKNIQTILLS